MADLDAIVVGAGPNGLTAAVTLARAGLRVQVFEGAETVGGGARTEELTLPGFRHDTCSAIHPLGAGSPALRELGLERYGLSWVHPDLPLAHPFPDGTAAVLARSMTQTAGSLGGGRHEGADRGSRGDPAAYLRLIRPFRGRWDALAGDVLRPPLAGWPRHPLVYGWFGALAALPAAALARAFAGERARGLIAGLAGHVTAPLTSPLTGGIALMFALAAHEVGWPFPRGGTQAISAALAALLADLGGQVETGRQVRSLAELPTARAYLLDTSPEQAAAIAGSRLPEWYSGLFLRRYRHGPAVFKIDYALSGPVPWTAPAARRAGTVHLGPSLAEISAALVSAQRGTAPRPPFLITAQPSVFDPARAPEGSHVFWVYAQVPNAWRGDLTAAIEAQVERFAPGFRDLVLARAVTTPADLAARNPNNVGGDIAGGRCDRLRLLLRPTPFPVPYVTPDPAIYLCSSATPPGPGVHGMCGYHAAQAALRRLFQLPGDPMRWFAAPDYWLARLAFQRGLAAIYLIGFAAAGLQFRALLGEHGMLPIPRYLRRVRFRQAPSLFHLHYSDRFFAAVAWSGAALAAAMAAGLGDAVPLWAAMLAWLALWALYQSIVNVGQVWYGFGWESLLLETGFLAVFLGNASTAPPVLVLWLLRWLLLRLEFGAGLIKLRGDRCWRDLTCLRYHHETQPMPGPLSWFFHHLPDPVHRAEVLGNHLAQLVAPLALLAPQPAASVAAAVMIVTQLWLVASGNFAWLNWLTIVIALGVVDTGLAARVLPLPAAPRFAAAPPWYQALVIAVTAVVAVLSYRPARNLMSRRQLMNASFDPLHLVNAYGAFGSITRRRYELVIEGTREQQLTAATRWREYEFKGKPGDPRRRPPQVAPYHLRLDWLMWFAALSPGYAEAWLAPLLYRLLRADRDVLRLLRANPFPDGPPAFVRVSRYRYRFTSWRQLRRSGAWWDRAPAGVYLEPVRLHAPASGPP
jgi:phytoene dehydrogenase-like protein